MKPAKLIWIAAMLCSPVVAQQLRVFIRASDKTHGPAGNGLHDYPTFLTTWTSLLKERGATVDGARRFPTAEELAKTDVLIDFAADGGTVTPEDRVVLEAYLKRGGGIVVMHDGMCSNDPEWFASLVGGAKKHGERNWRAGKMTVHIEDKAHPIMKGLSDFEIDDEMFFLLRSAAEMHVLASTPDPSGKIVPQLWTYVKGYRAFVSLQGHHFATLQRPDYQTILLRGIAWVGKRPADSLAGKKQD